MASPCSASTRRRAGRRGGGARHRDRAGVLRAGARPAAAGRVRPRDGVIANNVMAHVPDLNGFVEGIAILLADDGVATIENPTCATCRPLRVRHDLPRALLLLLVHGGRPAAAAARAHARARRALPDPRRHAALVGREARAHREESVQRYLDEEAAAAGRVRLLPPASRSASSRSATSWSRCSAGSASEGSRIAAYGAAAKGSTLLNYVGLGTDLIDFVVDRNPHKQGQSDARRARPDPAARGAARASGPTTCSCSRGTSPTRSSPSRQEYRAAGGRFIVPGAGAADAVSIEYLSWH